MTILDGFIGKIRHHGIDWFHCASSYPRKGQKIKVSLLKPDSKEKEVKLEDFTIRI